MQQDWTATPFRIVGPEGIFEGESLERYPHTIAADALRLATRTNWQVVDYVEVEPGVAWNVEGLNDDGGRSGPYRLTLLAGLPR